MIPYCTDMSLKKWINAPGVGYHDTKWRTMTSVTVTKALRKAPRRRCYGTFLSFKGLSVYLLMEMMQKTLHGMQMEETTMKCFDIRLIPLSGRKLIICIRISAKRQEIFGLDLSLMEWIPMGVWALSTVRDLFC